MKLWYRELFAAMTLHVTIVNAAMDMEAAPHLVMY
jgi:hypothetical protein